MSVRRATEHVFTRWSTLGSNPETRSALELDTRTAVIGGNLEKLLAGASGVGRRRTPMTLEDIRDTDKDQYWETLRQRWGALMSYRYIGRQFSSMNKADDDTVTLRHDMRNAAGGILSPDLLDQRARRRGTVRPRGRPEPGDPLVADPRQRQRRAAHRGGQRRRAQGRHAHVLRAGDDRRRRQPRPRARAHRGAGRVDRRRAPAHQGRPAVRGRPDRARRGLARPPAHLAGVRRQQARRRPLGARRARRPSSRRPTPRCTSVRSS